MSKNLMIRLSDEDHKLLNDAAHDARLSMAEFVREGIALRLASSGPPVPTEDSMMRALELLVSIAKKLDKGYELVRPGGPGAATADRDPDPGPGAEDLCFAVVKLVFLPGCSTTKCTIVPERPACPVNVTGRAL